MEQFEHQNESGEYGDAFSRLRTAKNWLWGLLLTAILVNIVAVMAFQYWPAIEILAVQAGDAEVAPAPAAEAAEAAQPKAVPPAAGPAEESPAAPEPPAEAATAEESDLARAPAPVDEPSDQQTASFIYEALRPGLAMIRAGSLFCGVLLALMLLLSVKMSLVGRLGSAGYLTSAMLWSLVLAVLLAPWNLAFPGFPVPGMLFGHGELVAMTAEAAWGAAEVGWETSLLYWARMVGYPVLGLILLAAVQVQYARARRGVMAETADEQQ